MQEDDAILECPDLGYDCDLTTTMSDEMDRSHGKDASGKVGKHRNIKDIEEGDGHN